MIIYFNNESIRGSSFYWSLADAGANMLREVLAAPRGAPNALQLLNLGLGPVAPKADAALETTVFGLTFAAPVGVAAGFDKRGLAPRRSADGLWLRGGRRRDAGAAARQRAAARLRLKEDKAVVISSGYLPKVLGVAARLKNTEKTCIVGANVTKNAVSTDAVADHARVVKALDGAVDHVVVSVVPERQGQRRRREGHGGVGRGGAAEYQSARAAEGVADLDERQRRGGEPGSG